MPRYHAHIPSPWDPDQAFAYMADFSNAAEWDPGVLRATTVVSDGTAPGGAFDLVVRTLGRETTLRYVVTACEARRITFLASTSQFESEDTVTVKPRPGGSVVEYEAGLRLRGAARVFTPILALALRRIGDRARAGLTRRLGEPAP